MGVRQARDKAIGRAVTLDLSQQGATYAEAVGPRNARR